MSHTDESKKGVEDKESTVQLQAIYENAPFIMLILNEERRVVKANRTILDKVRGSIDGLVGKYPGEILHCRHRFDSSQGCGFGEYCMGKCDIYAMMQEVLTKGAVVKGEEASILAEDDYENKYLYLLVSASPLHMNDSTKNILFCAEDITGKKNALKEKELMNRHLMHTEKMKALGQLAGGISHEFNNIIGAIIGYVELAIEDLDEDSRAAGNLRKSMDAIEKLERIVAQIQSFNKQQAGERAPHYLGKALEDIRSLLKSSMPSSITIETQIESESAQVSLDMVEFGQLIINACTNAIEAMAEQGTIVLRIEEMQLKHTVMGILGPIEPGTYSVLIITDEGKGIDSENVVHIFEPFFTSKPPGEGAGMGLAVVHSIMRNHRGNITVSPHEDTGTSFSFFFPQISVSKHKVMEMPISLPRGHGVIVLVDDEPLYCELGTSLFSKLGYEVHTFTDSIEAWAFLQEKGPHVDLVVADYMMPGYTGTALIRLVKAAYPQLPCILVTGYQDSVLSNHLEQIDIFDVLNKPVTRMQWATSLKSAMEKRENNNEYNNDN